jgi:hypothetical protein
VKSFPVIGDLREHRQGRGDGILQLVGFAFVVLGARRQAREKCGYKNRARRGDRKPRIAAPLNRLK